MAGQNGTPTGACVEPEPPVNVTAAAADPPYRGHEPVRLVLVPSARTLRSAVTVVAHGDGAAGRRGDASAVEPRVRRGSDRGVTGHRGARGLDRGRRQLQRDRAGPTGAC